MVYSKGERLMGLKGTEYVVVLVKRYYLGDVMND